MQVSENCTKVRHVSHVEIAGEVAPQIVRDDMSLECQFCGSMNGRR